MKANNKYIFRLVAILTLIFGVYSCNETDSIENSEAQRKIISTEYLLNFDYDIVGYHHNKGLEYIYEQLNNNIEGKDNNEIYNLVFASAEDYITQEEEFGGVSNDILNLIRPATNHNSNEDYISYLETKILADFSTDFSQEQFININNIFNNFVSIENYTSDNVIENLKIIEENIIGNNERLEIEEYVLLRSLISTGIYSVKYWEENLTKWENLNSNNIASKRGWGWFKETIKKMAVADAYGAGVGAVVGAVTSAPTGPGIVVGAAAGAVGYGMNSSAVAGVRELLN